MKQILMYELNLAKIGGSGDFTCPKCQNAISPDDCTEKSYTILEAKGSNQSLEELLIRCNKCGSELHLTGFSLLQKLERACSQLKKAGK